MKNKKMGFALCLILCVCVAVGVAASIKKDDKPTKPTNDSKTSSSEITTSTTTEPEKIKRVINPNDKLIALTFDDGPYSPVTNKILDVLEANDSVATFFVVGNRLEGNDSYQASMKRAYKLGCEIGSHTYSHSYLNQLSAEQLSSELNKTSDIVEKVIGEKTHILRPPGGFSSSSVDYPLIMWSVDSLDWKNREVNADYHNVIDSVYDGCIVLMHDLYPASADAAAKFIPELISQGYKFVTVSELAEARGIKLEGGKSFFDAKPTPPTQTSTDADNIVE